jgi:hypothetical protein
MLNCLLLRNTISKESRTLILSSLTLAIGVISQGSYAEDLTQEKYLEVSAQIATKSVQATNDKNALQLDTIVVTARRRVEEAQKVPAPITVLQGKHIEEARFIKYRTCSSNCLILPHSLFMPDSQVWLFGVSAIILPMKVLKAV